MVTNLSRKDCNSRTEDFRPLNGSMNLASNQQKQNVNKQCKQKEVEELQRNLRSHRVRLSANNQNGLDLEHYSYYAQGQYTSQVLSKLLF